MNYFFQLFAYKTLDKTRLYFTAVSFEQLACKTLDKTKLKLPLQS